jgi:hypothetical protein
MCFSLSLGFGSLPVVGGRRGSWGLVGVGWGVGGFATKLMWLGARLDRLAPGPRPMPLMPLRTAAHCAGCGLWGQLPAGSRGRGTPAGAFRPSTQHQHQHTPGATYYLARLLVFRFRIRRIGLL